MSREKRRQCRRIQTSFALEPTESRPRTERNKKKQKNELEKLPYRKEKRKTNIKIKMYKHGVRDTRVGYKSVPRAPPQ